EPFDKFRCRHRVKFDAMGLQPIIPIVAVVAVAYIVGDRLTLVAHGYSLDFKIGVDGLPWLQADIDDGDLARTARLRFFLERLIDHRAGGVGVMHTKDR